MLGVSIIAAGYPLAMCAFQYVDLAAGHQPMQTERFVLVYNGEIYNHPELRSELIGLGHQFHTHCDTEVVLAAFDEWGTGCSVDLMVNLPLFCGTVWNNGSFSAAIGTRSGHSISWSIGVRGFSPPR